MGFVQSSRLLLGLLLLATRGGGGVLVGFLRNGEGGDLQI